MPSRVSRPYSVISGREAACHQNAVVALYARLMSPTQVSKHHHRPDTALARVAVGEPDGGLGGAPYFFAWTVNGLPLSPIWNTTISAPWVVLRFLPTIVRPGVSLKTSPGPSLIGASPSILIVTAPSRT